MAKWVWGILILAIVSVLLTTIGPWNAEACSIKKGESAESALMQSTQKFADSKGLYK
ncbi:MAG: hypothetical protein HKN36_09790 [Hellea sp.]|nr:hypothetical protein [Hellea sp.]